MATTKATINLATTTNLQVIRDYALYVQKQIRLMVAPMTFEEWTILNRRK